MWKKKRFHLVTVVREEATEDWHKADELAAVKHREAKRQQQQKTEW